MFSKKRDVITEYDPIRIANGMKPLQLKMYKESDKEKVMLYAVTEFIPRVWKDLDEILEINKKEQITSRMTKLNGSSNKCIDNPILSTLGDIEDQDFEFLDKLKLQILETVKNLLKGSKNKIDRTIETLNSPNGRIMLTIVSAYCLGEALIEKFGYIEASKKLEVTIMAKKEFENEIREAFKNSEFEDAISFFKSKIKEYGIFLVGIHDVPTLMEEEYLYKISDKNNVLNALGAVSEQVRLEVTNQPRLLIEEY